MPNELNPEDSSFIPEHSKAENAFRIGVGLSAVSGAADLLHEHLIAGNTLGLALGCIAISAELKIAENIPKLFHRVFDR
jgi:hypothetical protein